MKINKILSVRNYQDPFFYQVMYEWEDSTSLLAEIPIRSPNVCLYALSKILDKNKHMYGVTRKIRQGREKNALALMMFANCYSNYFPYHIIPVFFDTFDRDYDKFVSLLKNIDIAVFTNYAFFEKIKKEYPNKRLYYVPQGIGTKWNLSSLPDKDIDVVQMGRTNQKLHTWMLKFCEQHPDINYIYRDTFENQNYISTISGNIGKLDTRDDYMRLLKRAKISLVSTVNVDSPSGDFEFFTPRFSESASMLCHMIGRYSANKESRILNIESVCKKVDSYEEFEDALRYALTSDVDIDVLKAFTENTSFAKWIAEILF